MKRTWPIIYLISIPLLVFSGYSTPHDAPNTNVDWVLLVIIPIVTTLLPLGLFVYGIHYSQRPKMPRPTLDRHLFGWWTDTLQPLRCSSIGTGLIAIGAIAAYPGENDQARMLIYSFALMAVSLIFGELLVYRIFRNRITE